MQIFSGKLAYLLLAVPVVVAMAEPAFGHVMVAEGKMVLTGNAGGSSSDIDYGNSNPASCSGSTTGAQATSSGGSVGIVVSPLAVNGACGAVQTLTGSNYKVLLLNNADPASGEFDCIHNYSYNPVISIGTMHIDKAGNGSGSYALPNGLAVTAPDGALVCITDQVKDTGNPYARVHGLSARLTIVP